MNSFQIAILAFIQGAAELLPVSSSAHVIAAEKLMGLDPSSPEMTFLLVMLHTGTMCAVLIYFWPRWRSRTPERLRELLKQAILATAVTGFLGLGLKLVIEKVILEAWLGQSKGEVESLFKSLPLISFALFSVGLLIQVAGSREIRSRAPVMNLKQSLWIGCVQGLCLPFRGFSRSGATISAGLLLGVRRDLAEDFSFILAVLLTPAVVVHELHRLMKSVDFSLEAGHAFLPLVMPGLFGMGMSFLSGWAALWLLSDWLERGRWKYFGVYCWIASAGVLGVHFYLS